MTIYKSIPVVVEAFRFDGSGASSMQILKWLAAHGLKNAEYYDDSDRIIELDLKLPSVKVAHIGDYIIRIPEKTRTQFLVMTEDQFKATYTPASNHIYKKEVPVVKISVDLVARVVHEANRILQIQSGEVPLSPNYDNAPDWQKDSAFEGIHKALAGETPEQLHESWCEFKRMDGWRFGPVKDEVLKAHPCLVPYNMLPKDQKIKDFMFQAIVQAFKDAPEVEI